MNFELEYIEKLVNLVSESELTELVLENGDQVIELRKEREMVTAQPVALQQPVSTSAPSPTIEAEAPIVKKGTPITSPMVGTFYQAPSPGAANFVEVGKSISKGQVVCIVEAMKLMNEIESEVSGTVLEVCVEDGQPVEFGQVLMYVE